MQEYLEPEGCMYKEQRRDKLSDTSLPLPAETFDLDF